MSKLIRKLHSKRGASLMLAMVFMLFCAFVGGSVLAASTANAGRVANQTHDEQTYLSQRSAALLMADLLKGSGNTPLQLTITDVKTSTGDRTVTFSLNDSNAKSYLQKLMVENAVANYLVKSPLQSGESSIFENFKFVGVASYSYTTPGAPSGTFKITESNGTEPNSTELDAAYHGTKFEGGSQALTSDYFDFVIDFGTDSLLSLHTDASYSEGNPIKITEGDITTTTTTTVIQWSDPVIEKGGA